MKKSLLLIPSLLLFFAFQAIGQKTVTGTVTATDGEPLIGVNILEVGTSTGTITDFDGTYSLQVAGDDAVLEFSYTGYDPMRITVGNQTVVDITLEEGIQLEEIVVTSLGISREKKSLGYAMTELKSEDISVSKETNVINQLAGRVAGVTITQSTAGPGSGSRVIIRGNNSLSGNNQPLYVVDGIPVDNSGFGSASGGGTANYQKNDYGTGISDINSDDIESISVLKGPNAAALYGSRASNGVILITTKKGKSGKGIGVSLSSHYSYDTPMLLPDYQNEYGQGADGNTYTDLEELKSHGGSWGAKMDNSQQLYWTGETRSYSAQPDNVKDFFEAGHNMVNTLALEGGTDAATFRFSYTNTDVKSFIPNSDLGKHNFNLRGFAKLSDRLTIDAKGTYFLQDAKNRPYQGTQGIMAYLYDIPRNIDITDFEDYQNEEDYSVRTYTSNTNGNPYWILYNDKNDDTRNRFTGFVKATYELTDNLSVFARIGSDAVTQNIEQISNYGHHFSPKGSVSFRTYQNAEVNSDFLFMYNKSIVEDFSINVNFGGNAMYQTYNAHTAGGGNFKIPTKATLASLQDFSSDYTPLREKKIHSLYGSAQFSYRNFAYLDLSARNDWSSTLPADNWSYFYPSASLSLVLSELIESPGILDYLKVRFSWAQVGSDTGPYQLDNAYSLNQSGYLGLTTLSTSSVRLNPDLKPEQTASLEMGLEFRLLHNRVYADITYYDITSTDLIMNIPINPASGFSSFKTNVGELKNRGFEFLIGGEPVRTQDFSWDIGFNFAKNKNELIELFGDLENYIFSTNNAGSVLVQATVDGEFGEIWATEHLTTDDGRLIVTDDGYFKTNSEKVLMGNYQPDWVGGLANNLTYKGFSLRCLIDARIGGKVYAGTNAALTSSGVSKESLEYREGGIIIDGVINTGTDEVPVYVENTNLISANDYWSGYTGATANYVFDQTNIRLREASLTYQFPQAMLGDSFIKGVSIGVVGRNLFFLYKDLPDFDPESSYSTSNFAQGMLYYNLPTIRSVGVNLNVKF